MRAVVQRCLDARVDVDGVTTGKIDRGLVVFVGAGCNDTPRDIEYLVNKILHLRIFEDDAGKMNHDVTEVSGAGILVVSQFTVWGDARKGFRPSFVKAMNPKDAEVLYDQFVACLRALGAHVQTGVFRADMRVHVVNDGPVTILLDSEKTF